MENKVNLSEVEEEVEEETRRTEQLSTCSSLSKHAACAWMLADASAWCLYTNSSPLTANTGLAPSYKASSEALHPPLAS